MKNAIIGAIIGSATWVLIFPWLLMSPAAQWYEAYAAWVYALYR